MHGPRTVHGHTQLCLRTLDTHRPRQHHSAPMLQTLVLCYTPPFHSTSALAHAAFVVSSASNRPRGSRRAPRGDHGEGIGSGKMLNFPSPTLPVSLISSEMFRNVFFSTGLLREEAGGLWMRLAAERKRFRQKVVWQSYSAR